MAEKSKLAKLFPNTRMARASRPIEDASQVDRIIRRVEKLGLSRIAATREVARRVAQSAQSDAREAPRRRAVAAAAPALATAARTTVIQRRARTEHPSSSTALVLHRPGRPEPPLRRLAGMPRSRSLEDAPLRAFLRSGQYNVAFALGHDAGGIMPMPLKSPGKPDFPYQACTGYTNQTFTVAAGQWCVVAVAPHSINPVIVRNNPNPVDPLIDVTGDDRADNTTWADDDTTPSGTMSESTWIGLTDPRILVTGLAGPAGTDVDPRLPGQSFMQQQFMGGKILFKASAALEASGQIAVIDTKSYPTMYGPKLPYKTALQTTIADAGGQPIQSYPDQEDFLRIFNHGAFVSLPLTSIASGVRNVGIVGAGESSDIHVPTLIPPDGQMWSTFSGAYQWTANGGPPLNHTIGTASIGGPAVRNWANAVGQGYPLYILQNNASSGSMTVTILGEWNYNIALPTVTQPVLAMSAPVTEAHSSAVSKIASVPVPHTDFATSHESHCNATHQATVRAGLPLPPGAVKGPGIIAPQMSHPRPSAGATLLHSVEDVASTALKALAPIGIKKVAGWLEKLF